MNKVTTALSKQAIERFHTRGYLTLDALIPEEEVEQLRQIYDRLFSEKTGWDKGDQFDLAGTDEGEAALPQLLGPSRYAPELRETHYVRNARFIARQLLGPEMIEKHGEHMIFKPAERGAATPASGPSLPRSDYATAGRQFLAALNVQPSSPAACTCAWLAQIRRAAPPPHQQRSAHSRTRSRPTRTL